jgi:hypothetical protein
MLRILAIPAIVMLTVSTAHASSDAATSLAKIPIIYGAGDTIDDLGPCPSLPGVQAGYKYWSLRIFWVNVWTSGGEYVLYKEDAGKKTYSSLGDDRDNAAKITGISDLHKPFSYSYPTGLLVLGGIVVLGVVSKIARKAGPQAG